MSFVVSDKVEAFAPDGSAASLAPRQRRDTP
jgi:hypothetical protein